MRIREKELEAKGWSSEQISHAKNTLATAKQPNRKFIEEIVLWLLLILVAGGSLVGAWIAQPLLLIMNPTQALLSLGIIGILFGLFAGWIIAELEELETHHHLFMTISIPFIAIISSFLIHSRVQQMVALSPAFANINHNPFIMALTYTFATVIPYSILLYVEKKRYGTQ